MGTPGEKIPNDEIVQEPSSSEAATSGIGPSESATSADMTVLQNVPSLGIFIEQPDLGGGPQLSLRTLEDLEKQLLLDTTDNSSDNSSFVGFLEGTSPVVSQLPIASSSTTVFQDLSLPGPSGLQTPKTSKPEQFKVAPKRSKKPPQSSQTSKKAHSCPVCQKSFQTSGKLAAHQLVHSGGTPFKCEHCKKSFSSKFKLVRHVLIHSDRKPFSCTVCERTFHRKDHLKNHVKVHSPSKKVYLCERVNCKKEYTSLMSYRKHLALHAAEEGSLDCKICSKTFESKADILYHLKVHAGSRTVKNPNEKKFTCDYCDRKFFTRKDVRRHLVVHTGTRNFLCQFCPQRFGRKDHLVRHIKKSHSRNYSEIDSTSAENTIQFEQSESSSFTDIKIEPNFELPSHSQLDDILDYTDESKDSAVKLEPISSIKLEEIPEVQNLLFSRNFPELSPMLCSEPDQLQFISHSSSEPELPQRLPSDSELLTELEGSASASGLLEVEPQLLPEDMMDTDLLRLISEGGIQISEDENTLPLPGFSQVFKQQDPQPPS